MEAQDLFRSNSNPFQVLCFNKKSLKVWTRSEVAVESYLWGIIRMTYKKCFKIVFSSLLYLAHLLLITIDGTAIGRHHFPNRL